ncbi:hypothetical protein ACVW0Y_003780 [Pseudomonas sp. TE3786]
MIMHRLFILGLAPTRKTYFRLLELAPLMVLVALWRQDDLTWINGAAAMLAMWALYASAPLIIKLQRSRLNAMHVRDCARLDARIAQEKTPKKQRWLQEQAEKMPLRGHLVNDPMPTFEKYRQLASLFMKIASWMHKRG